MCKGALLFETYLNPKEAERFEAVRLQEQERLRALAQKMRANQPGPNGPKTPSFGRR